MQAAKNFPSTGRKPRMKSAGNFRLRSTVSCDSSAEIWKIIGCNTTVNTESSRRRAEGNRADTE